MDPLVYNTLVTDEVYLVRSMRRFLFKEEQDRSILFGDAELAVVQTPICRLLELLWQYDSFLVDLLRPGDPNVSVFELQLLYTIAAQRDGHSTIVSEVLAWWLPKSAQSAAVRQLSTIVEILDRAGMADQSIERLKAHILALTSARCRDNDLATIVDQMPIPSSRVLH